MTTSSDPRIERVLDGGPCNATVVRIVGGDLRQTVGTPVFEAATKMTQEPAVLAAALDRALAAYDKRRAELDFGNRLVAVNNAIVKTALTLPLGANATIAGKAVGMVANATLDQVQRMVENAAKEEQRRLLRTQLAAYEQAMGGDAYQNLLRTQDPQAFSRELHARVDATFSPAFDRIPPEDRDLVQAFQQKQTAAIVADGFDAVLSLEVAHGEALDVVRRNVAGLSYALYRHAKDTGERLDRLQRTQQEIQAGMESMNERLGKTEKGVAFLQEYTFGRMTPREQLAALRSEQLDLGLSEDERHDLEAKIELVVKRQVVCDDLSGFVSGARDLANIASNLHVDPAITRTLSIAAAAGEQIFSGFTAFASGNILGGISALSNLFGLGGRDVAAERHQQVMQALDRIYGGIHDVQQKLDVMDRKLDALLHGQVAIYEAIVQLGDLVAQNHAALVDELRRLRGEALISRELLTDEISSEYAAGRRFLFEHPTVDRSERIIDMARDQLPSYERFAREYRIARDSFRLCWERVTRLFADAPAKFHSAFYLRSYDQIEDASPENRAIANRRDAELYGGALRFLKDRYAGAQPTLRRYLEGLRVPIEAPAGLDGKRDALMSVSIDALEGEISTERLLRRMANLLSVDAIERHCDVVGNFYVYRQMIDDDDRLINPEHLIDARDEEDDGRFELECARILVETALMQYVLMSGDLTLPDLAAAFLAGDDAAGAVIASNPVLASNFMLYAVRKEVGAHYLAYSAALKSLSSYALYRLLNPRWVLLRREDVGDAAVESETGWRVRIGHVVLPLPTEEAIYDGKFRFLPEVLRLLRLRDFIVTQLVSYDVDRDLAAADRRTFHQVLLNASR